MGDRIDQVQAAMVEYFGEDSRRIDHAQRVTAYACDLMETEPGDPDLVVATALLHDIGIREAERKYGSAAGNLQEIEGPPVAREILSRLGFSEPFITEVCTIIASHHSPGEVETDNFRIIWDADWLVNLGDECDTGDKEKLSKIIDRTFLTRSGRQMAKRIYQKG
ncbi:MAG TPA: HD domain-containing protein [Geobacteraceae bacterium]|nr:HD domain-containing protein [Geobacteraceae bacterium]